MSKLPEQKRNRELWLQQRKKGIGGSDAAGILGASQYSSAFQVYLDKTSEDISNIDSENILWGNILEDVIADEFTRRTGKKTQRHDGIIHAKDYDFLIASVDRLIVGENAGLEIKTIDKDRWRMVTKEQDVPPEYIVQCQHYINVTGTDYWYLAILIGGNKMVHFKLERDQGFIDDMVKKEVDFWNNHVLKEIPPEISAFDTVCVNEMHSIVTREEILELPETYIALIEEVLEKKSAIKMMENRLDELTAKIKNQIGDSMSGSCENYIVDWKPVTVNKVNTGNLRRKYPEIYEQCLSTSEYRRFNIRSIK